eukprot:scaffold17601_cov57-Cyclotella_meneghiniana.AAC.1
MATANPASVTVDDEHAIVDSLLPNTCMTASPYEHYHEQLRRINIRSKQKECKTEEDHVRNIARHYMPTIFVMNLYAAFKVFFTMLLNIESLLALALTVGFTLYGYHMVLLQEEQATQLGMEYNWNGTLPTVLLSFAVITPISSSITMAFTRRENALVSLAKFRSSAYNLYLGHATWDWSQAHKNKGRRGCVECKEDLAAVYGDETKNDVVNGDRPIDFMQHSETLLRQLIQLSDALYVYLTLPSATRAIQRVTSRGRTEANQIITCGRSLFTLNVNGRMILISQLCEALKHRGMPGNEASRVRQWEEFMTNAMESLRNVKVYRTPQALRSFGRLFTMFLPAFYAPSYIQVARDTHSLPFGVALGVVTTIALTALFECVRQLEDPFVNYVTLDGIDVREELVVLLYQELMTARAVTFPEAGEFKLKSDEYTISISGRGRTFNESVDADSDFDRTSRHKC